MGKVGNMLSYIDIILTVLISAVQNTLILHENNISRAIWSPDIPRHDSKEGGSIEIAAVNICAHLQSPNPWCQILVGSCNCAGGYIGRVASRYLDSSGQYAKLLLYGVQIRRAKIVHLF
eukprot:scaffold5067_cov139-Cylindrotheca_fusiformis.AAC.6